MTGAKRRQHWVKSVRLYLAACMIMMLLAPIMRILIIDITPVTATTFIQVASVSEFVGTPFILPTEPEPKPAFTEIGVCNSSASKTYLDHSLISSQSTQGRYIDTHMTSRNGLLYDKDNFIGVALGSYFGIIGNRFIFTLSTGIELRVVKVEEKSDAHTYGGCVQRWDRSVLEFVIDSDTSTFWIGTNGYVANGNFNNLSQFNGTIIKIMKEQ
jgi:hypothetical protein